MPIISVNPDKAAAIDRAAAIAELDNWFARQCEFGVITSGGWRMKLAAADVSLYTGNFVLAKEAAALGMALPPLIDGDGGVHPIADIEELTAIMLVYGNQRAMLSQEYARRRAEIGA